MPRAYRLTSAASVRRVLARGSRFRSGSLEVAWLGNEAGHPRLGLVVPKYRSNAVARNRLRRRLKELWRRRGLPTLGPIDVVVRVRPAAYRASFADLAQVVEEWCKVMG